MKYFATTLTRVLASWWGLLCGFGAIVAAFLTGIPDPGSIISLRTTWWMVAAIVLAGVLGVWLLLAALRSFTATMVLTVVALLVFVLSFHDAFLRLVGLLMSPTLLLIPLLWQKHRGISSFVSVKGSQKAP
jgi:glucan phosphoethanolaminetransferase (alkaline phosphatase superfamily)